MLVTESILFRGGLAVAVCTRKYHSSTLLVLRCTIKYPLPGPFDEE